MAIRIARSAAGRDKIAICGYHGWHDWYLAANLNNKSSLDDHLMPVLIHWVYRQDLKTPLLVFSIIILIN